MLVIFYLRVERKRDEICGWDRQRHYRLVEAKRVHSKSIFVVDSSQSDNRNQLKE